MKPLLRWTTRVYDGLAGWYDWLDRWVFSVGRQGRTAVLKGLPPGRLLDVGCGTGDVLAAVHANGRVCVGVDTSAGMLAEARKKTGGGVLLVQASFYQLPFQGGSFPVVVETNSFSAADVAAGRALDEMLRVCAAQGEVRLADYAPPPGRSLTRWERILWVLGGDFPHDYVSLLEMRGCKAVVQVLAGNMYQYIRARKPHSRQEL